MTEEEKQAFKRFHMDQVRKAYEDGKRDGREFYFIIGFNLGALSIILARWNA